MTLRLILKALRLLWPYLRSAVFRDRTTLEVIRENTHLTIMLILIFTLIGALSLTTIRLSEIKEGGLIVKETIVYQRVPCECNSGFDKKRLNELIKELEDEH